MSKISTNGEAGFTLIELLIALLLFGLLSAAVFAALRIGSTTLSRVAWSDQEAKTYILAEQVMDRYLSSAYPEYIAPVIPGIAGHIAFDGEPESINFLSESPQATAPGGLAAMRLWVDDKNGSKTLALAERAELAWPGQAPAAEEILLDGVSAAVFSYYGADQKGGANYWHESWTGRTSLPVLIKVQVQLAARAGETWPSLLIAPRLRIDDGCKLVPQSLVCWNR